MVFVQLLLLLIAFIIIICNAIFNKIKYGRSARSRPRPDTTNNGLAVSSAHLALILPPIPASVQRLWRPGGGQEVGCRTSKADRSIFDMVVNRESERPYTRKACLSACAQVRTVQVCGCNTRRIDFEVSSA